MSSDDPSADFDPDYASARPAGRGDADEDGSSQGRRRGRNAGRDTERNTGRRQPRKPRKITPEYLRRVALHYLDRYSATEASLRAVLNRRIRKSATLHEPDPDIPAWVDALLDDMKRLGFINDEAFAQTRAVSLHRSGKSARAIRQTLVGKGIRGEALDRAVAAAADELGHGADTRAMDRRAGLEFARRRRLGVFNPLSEVRAERREKDMAALARRGFSYDICLAVVEARDEDDLRDRLELDLDF